MLVPLGGTQTCLRKVTETSVVLLKCNLITLEVRHFEIDIFFSSSRIVQLAKSKAITHFFFTHETVFFSQATQKLRNSNMPYCKTKNPVKLNLMGHIARIQPLPSYLIGHVNFSYYCNLRQLYLRNRKHVPCFYQV